MNNDKSKYWEDYMKYWQDKIEESNDNDKSKVDKSPGDDILFKCVDLLNIKKEENFLDFGCGTCRIYPYIKKKDVDYYGLDIANSMIEFSLNKYPELKDNLLVSKNNISFKKNFFDNVFCFGVFDACNQEDTILHILKIMKIGGRAFITGKNIKYNLDDKAAYTAEINARKKGHPNYFTDLEYMMKQLYNYNVEIKKIYYFEYRGDFGKEKYSKSKPERFYEFAILIEKKEGNKEYKFEKFSHEFSETFYELNSN